MDPSSRIKYSKVFKNDYGRVRLYRGWVAPPLPSFLGRDCCSIPANISHAADSRLSRTRVESSPPSPRVGTDAGPDLTLDIVAKSWLCQVGAAAVPDCGFIPRQICFYCVEPGACLLTSLFGFGVGRVGLRGSTSRRRRLWISSSCSALCSHGARQIRCWSRTDWILDPPRDVGMSTREQDNVSSMRQCRKVIDGEVCQLRWCRLPRPLSSPLFTSFGRITQ